MPGTKTTSKSWKTRSRSANKAQTYKELTEQARAFPGRSAGGPAPPSERAQTKVSRRAPKAPRAPQKRDARCRTIRTGRRGVLTLLSLAVDEALQLLRTAGMTQLAQRLGFDLADAFARHFEVLADFFQRVIALFADAEAHA